MGEDSRKEVEITPAMLAAGASLLAEDYGICGADIAPGIASRVFKTMWAQSNQREPEPNS